MKLNAARQHDTVLTSEVFSQPHRVAWRWRRAVGDERNDYFQFGTPESLAVGGGGHFAIFLQAHESLGCPRFTLHPYITALSCMSEVDAAVVAFTTTRRAAMQEDLLRGSSGISATFGNPCLAGSSEFAVGKLEVWAVLPT